MTDTLLPVLIALLLIGPAVARIVWLEATKP